MPKMKRILLPIPMHQLKLLDELVEARLYSSGNDAIRHAIRDLLKYHDKL